MSTVAAKPLMRSPVRDEYRLGDGPKRVIQLGTMGWANADTLKFLLRNDHDASDVCFITSAEVDIRVEEDRGVRADAIAIWGGDIAKFEALRFLPPRTDGRQRTLTLPPTLFIEAVDRGHEVHDWQTQRRWYAEMGVPNYWLVDGLALSGGQYRDDGGRGGTDTVALASLARLVIPLPSVWDAEPMVAQAAPQSP